MGTGLVEEVEGTWVISLSMHSAEPLAAAFLNLPATLSTARARRSPEFQLTMTISSKIECIAQSGSTAASTIAGKSFADGTEVHLDHKAFIEGRLYACTATAPHLIPLRGRH